MVAIDVKRQDDGSFHVYVNGGRKDTGLDTIEWAKKAVALGAGEILRPLWIRTGTKSGYDFMPTAYVSVVNVPVIASGGAGTADDIVEVFEKRQSQRLWLPVFFTTVNIHERESQNERKIKSRCAYHETDTFELDFKKSPDGILPVIVTDV